MNFKSAICLGIGALLAGGTAQAATIPYPNSGTQNPVVYSFTAAATGNLSAYFLGSSASFNETLGLLVNGVNTGITGFPNHSTNLGTQLDFGNVTMGDTLTFLVNVSTTGATFYSDPARNADSANHIYSTSYAGGTFGTNVVPAGTYVGFEDLTASDADFNYADEQFVFTNTTTSVSAVPLPASLPLFGAAILGLGAVGFGLKRRKASAA